MKLKGTIIAAHGRQYLVELADGETLLCFPRGKKSELACGDVVSIQRSSDTQGVIDATDPRHSLLYRSNEFKQKLIAANVTQIVIVVASEPSFSDELITRCIVAAESQDIKALIVLNKCDLTDRLAAAKTAIAPYEKLGYPVLPLSAQGDVCRSGDLARALRADRADHRWRSEPQGLASRRLAPHLARTDRH